MQTMKKKANLQQSANSQKQPKRKLLLKQKQNAQQKYFYLRNVAGQAFYQQQFRQKKIQRNKTIKSSALQIQKQKNNSSSQISNKESKKELQICEIQVVNFCVRKRSFQQQKKSIPISTEKQSGAYQNDNCYAENFENARRSLSNQSQKCQKNKTLQRQPSLSFQDDQNSFCSNQKKGSSNKPSKIKNQNKSNFLSQDDFDDSLQSCQETAVEQRYDRHIRYYTTQNQQQSSRVKRLEQHKTNEQLDKADYYLEEQISQVSQKSEVCDTFNEEEETMKIRSLLSRILHQKKGSLKKIKSNQNFLNVITVLNSIVPVEISGIIKQQIILLNCQTTMEEATPVSTVISFTLQQKAETIMKKTVAYRNPSKKFQDQRHLDDLFEQILSF
ncbi:hypothetical protein ABPG72_017474 [Tetrahymena utriculariae]